MRESLRRFAAPSVALLALASSALSIVNWFTYDDRYVIEMNPLMRSLHHWWRTFALPYWPKDWGGDGYRPLTVLAFRAEGTAWHGIPFVYHLVNIALYMAVSVMVYRLARRLLPDWAAWVAAALFAVHPVHVEAVANVVGQSELWVALALLPAISLYLRDRLKGDLTLRTAFGVATLYAVACFAKEHGIVLPAILIAAELTVIRDARPWREQVRRLRPFYLVLVAVACSFVYVRTLVLSDHSLGGFAPFTPFSSLHIGSVDRALTALGVVPQWIRLFYWPVRLSSEYGPPGLEIAQGFSITQLPGLLLLVAIIAIGWILRRRRPVTSFGIALACIALLPSSNFIIPAGILLAERTMFFASVGAMLVLGDAIVVVAQRVRETTSDLPRATTWAQALLALVLVVCAVRSERRARVWHDNNTLFNQAVLDAPDAYRAHFMLAAWDFEKSRKAEGEAEYRRAIQLFPYDPFLSFNLAEQYRGVGLCEPALPLYKWVRELDPDFPFGRTGYSWCLLEMGQYDDAKAQALATFANRGDQKILRRIIFLADSAKKADANGAHAAHPDLMGDIGKAPEFAQKTIGTPTKQRLR